MSKYHYPPKLHFPGSLLMVLSHGRANLSIKLTAGPFVGAAEHY
jgi:hypothetical protein